MSYVDTIIDDMALFHDAPCDVLTIGNISGWGSGVNWPTGLPIPPEWEGEAVCKMWFHCPETSNNITAGDAARPWNNTDTSRYVGNNAPNTRVQIRGLQLWLLRGSGAGVWEEWMYTPTPGNQMYRANWDDYHVAGDYRIEPAANGGGASMGSIGRGDFENFLWHGWTTGIKAYPSGVRGIASCCYARLILDDPNGPDDRDQANILLGVAGDYFENAEVGQTIPTKAGVTVEPMGYSRLKFVTNEWQLFSFYHNVLMTEAQIRANPPPFYELNLIDDSAPDPEPEPDPDDPEPPSPTPPIVVPTRGSWEAITSGGKANWFAHAAAVTAPSKVRRSRRARMW